MSEIHNETEMNSIKKRAILVSKPFMWTYATIVIVGTLISFGGDIETLYKRFCQPKLLLEFSPSGPVNKGDKVVLGYRLPDQGYFSLWNSNGSGNLIRIIPDKHSAKKSVQLNEQNHLGEQWLQPNKSASKEQAILLWTKEHQDHPPESTYADESRFRHYLKMHNSYHWVEREAKLQVR